MAIDALSLFGLIFTCDFDPTTGDGLDAPVGSLLARTDVPSTYLKMGSNTTDWLKIGAA